MAKEVQFYSSHGDRDILTADWYAFTDCYGTSEEKD